MEKRQKLYNKNKVKKRNLRDPTYAMLVFSIATAVLLARTLSSQFLGSDAIQESTKTNNFFVYIVVQQRNAKNTQQTNDNNRYSEKK